jgi:hypothetical protein
MARKSKHESPYKEIVCEKCGYDFFRFPLEGMVAKPHYAVCGKCGHQQAMKPGDVLKNEDAKKSNISLVSK